MTHVIEAAASGRAKCRGCGELISKGEFRFGERLPNPFADGEMTIWFHLACGLLKRPEAFEEVLDEASPHLTAQGFTSDQLKLLNLGLNHHRLPRINGLERSPSGRAKCRHCHEPIQKDEFRVKLNFFEEGMFNAAGNIHLNCAAEYFETADFWEHLQLLSRDIPEETFLALKPEL